MDLTQEIHIKLRAKRRAEAVDKQQRQQYQQKKPPREAKKVNPDSAVILDPAVAVGFASAQILLETYWDSPEAKNMFLGNSTDDWRVVDVLKDCSKSIAFTMDGETFLSIGMT